MISKITLNNVASYKKPVDLETDKKINLIYGLNGTGKSTFSNYLYKQNDTNFNSCSIQGLDEEEVAVYNQTFVQDYFYESDSLNGIFTLSKENKDAEQKIKSAEKLIESLLVQKNAKTEEIDLLKQNYRNKKQHTENKVWEIKANYTGGDRVFEFCLEGLRGKKEKLFDHIISLSKPEVKPIKDIDDIKKEVQALTGENAQKYQLLPSIIFSGDNIEQESILSKQIVGNKNSSVADLISKLENSDWVKSGIDYLPKSIEKTEICPFCQQSTITQEIIDNLKEYFNETYENDIKKINQLVINYKSAIESFPQKIVFEQNPIVKAQKTEFDNKYDSVLRLLELNLSMLENKIKSPSQKITLNKSAEVVKGLADFVLNINNEIGEHNNKIDNKNAALKLLKGEFWNLMRWEYDQTISTFITDKSHITKKGQDLSKELKTFETKLSDQNKIIIEQQKKTINIEEAVESINNGLIELGISDFKIIKHSENHYKIVRGSEEAEIFHSLSEGEKMIISFLYFLELCRGKKNVSDSNKKKIVVIDDPISSLSHIYIFNIGQLIKSEFIRSKKYEQVFLLTHSLYFFYELTETNHERRKENQNLYRIVKNSEGSQILEMKYEEIQNDYHSYWNIIKDENQPAALIANCMRNIIEYFFNFIEKRDLGNVFQKPVLQENKYQSFGRYINRESHSLGQNIFDIKEFDYTTFKNGLKLIFEQNGYQEHYKRMMK
ncbi:AAA family ATPase [Saccharicrinis aurantiacus]|uniref:AAA family ATPase n=1 Tax=Saccharicrinis aurantiacus TaxID=1849719 RepID=UPI002491E23C|nr:AAA family ATPase [Saccharicrinis aurantiacus]